MEGPRPPRPHQIPVAHPRKDLAPDAPPHHRPPPSSQDRLRADVIERVRASRTAILSRARGGTAGESPALFRDGVRLELADILADEVTRAERHHRPDATPERRDASPAPSTSDDGMWNDDPIVKPRSRRSPSPAQLSSPALSWDEHAGTKLTSVEYEDLMLAMHEAVEEDLRREEAAMLAAELESVEAQEADELAAAVASFEAWTVDSIAAGAQLSSGGGDSTPAVPCPVCSTRRVLMTDDVLFCGCGNFRLARGEVPGERRVRARAGNRGGSGSSAKDGLLDAEQREASFGLDHLRRRLAETYAAHAENGGCDDAGMLAFDVRNAFGVEALWAECGRCGFIETVM